MGSSLGERQQDVVAGRTSSTCVNIMLVVSLSLGSTGASCVPGVRVPYGGGQAMVAKDGTRGKLLFSLVARMLSSSRAWTGVARCVSQQLLPSSCCDFGQRRSMLSSRLIHLQHLKQGVVGRCVYVAKRTPPTIAQQHTKRDDNNQQLYVSVYRSLALSLDTTRRTSAMPSWHRRR